MPFYVVFPTATIAGSITDCTGVSTGNTFVHVSKRLKIIHIKLFTNILNFHLNIYHDDDSDSELV